MYGSFSVRPLSIAVNPLESITCGANRLTSNVDGATIRACRDPSNRRTPFKTAYDGPQSTRGDSGGGCSGASGIGAQIERGTARNGIGRAGRDGIDGANTGERVSRIGGNGSMVEQNMVSMGAGSKHVSSDRAHVCPSVVAMLAYTPMGCFTSVAYTTKDTDCDDCGGCISKYGYCDCDVNL